MEYVIAMKFLKIGNQITKTKCHQQMSTKLRRFKTFFGVTPYVCAIIWNEISGQAEDGYKPKYLLWGLHFLKQYADEHTRHSLYRADEKTIRKWTWITVKLMSKLNVIIWENRMDGSVDGQTVFVSLDGVDFKIKEPTVFSPKWYSHKFRGPGLRYEIGLNIRTGYIVWTHEMKVNIVNKFICAALKITSPPHLNETIDRLRTTLSNSNYSKKFVLKSIFNVKKKMYPNSINVDPMMIVNFDDSCATSIDSSLDSDQPRKYESSVSLAERTTTTKPCSSRFKSNKHFRYASYREGKRALLNRKTPVLHESQVPESKNANHKFVAYPFCPSLKSSLTTCLKRCVLPNIRLAPAPIRQNRKYIFSSTKCKRLLNDVKNASFSLDCTECCLQLNLKTDSKDVARTILHHMNNNESPVFKHIHSHPGHVFGKPYNVRRYKDRKELDWLYPYSVSERLDCF